MSVKGFSKDGTTHRYDYNYLDNKPSIDTTLSQAGAIADAKATGDAVTALNEDIAQLQSDVSGKQDALTFDSTPTSGSTHPVTSGGVYTALADKQDTLTFDTEPTESSTKPVTSGGVYTELSELKSALSEVYGEQIVCTLANGTVPNAGNASCVCTTNYIPVEEGVAVHLEVSRAIESGAYYVFGYVIYDSSKTQVRKVDVTANVDNSEVGILSGEYYIRYSIGAYYTGGSQIALRIATFGDGDVVAVTRGSDNIYVTNNVIETKCDTAELVSDNIEDSMLTRQNLVASVMWEDGKRLHNSTLGVESNNLWSLSEYFPVDTSRKYYVYDYSDSSITGGAYVSLYDSDKTLLSITTISGSGGSFTPASDGYARVSCYIAARPTIAVTANVIFTTPSTYVTKDRLDTQSFNWYAGKVLIYSGSSLTYVTHSTYSTSNYIELEAGLYYIGTISAGGGYIVEFDKDTLTPLAGHTITKQKSFVTVSNNCYAILSVGTIDNSEFKFIKAEDYINRLDYASIAFYGDSITCLGNDFRDASWQGILKRYFDMGNAISVGIGGTGFVWNDSYGYDLTDHTCGESLAYGATWESGVSEHTSLCAWNRIEKTLSTDTELVFVMGGTNDFGKTIGTDLSCSASNTTDTEWVADADYTGGDYNISTVKGGILSTIMKIRTRCPNALVVFCTPLGGRGATSGTNQLDQETTNGLTTYDVAEAMKSACDYMNTPCVDLYGGCGITPYNRATYISDTVHPNTTGMRKIAEFMIPEFKKLSLPITDVGYAD